MPDDNEEVPPPREDAPKIAEAMRYTAFERHDYKEIIHEEEYEKPWISLSESFFRGGLNLVNSVVEGSASDEIEGIAGLFLFRHYLELALKQMVLSGRRLETPDRNALPENVRAVANEHSLAVIWRWVIADAKPKIDPTHWDSFDISFVEKCIAEFDAADRKGFAFRYHGYGIESWRFDFETLLSTMEHVYQVVEGLETYLIETYGQNADWERELRSQAGW